GPGCGVGAPFGGAARRVWGVGAVAPGCGGELGQPVCGDDDGAAVRFVVRAHAGADEETAPAGEFGAHSGRSAGSADAGVGSDSGCVTHAVGGVRHDGAVDLGDTTVVSEFDCVAGPAGGGCGRGSGGAVSQDAACALRVVVGSAAAA